MISKSTWDLLSEDCKNEIQRKYDDACATLEEIAFDSEDEVRLDNAQRLIEDLEKNFGYLLEKHVKKVFATCIGAGYVRSHRGFDETAVSFPNDTHDEHIIKKVEATLMIESIIKVHFDGMVSDFEIAHDAPLYTIKCDHTGNKWVELVKAPITDKLLLFRNKADADAFLSYEDNQRLLDNYFLINR